jgi:hypothetical protein
MPRTAPSVALAGAGDERPSQAGLEALPEAPGASVFDDRCDGLNMEGMSLVSEDEVQAIGTEVDKRLAIIGKKVQMVINYDNFYLDPALADDYKALIRSLAERYYASATRYTTSSFMRLKLSEHLSDRGLAPHIYESRQEAINWLGKQTPSSSVLT